MHRGAHLVIGTQKRILACADSIAEIVLARATAVQLVLKLVLISECLDLFLAQDVTDGLDQLWVGHNIFTQ